MKTNAKASRKTRQPEVPGAETDWTKTRMAAAVLAVANIVVFGVEAWKTWVDKLRVAALMRQLGAMAWPYPAYHPDYPSAMWRCRMAGSPCMIRRRIIW